MESTWPDWITKDSRMLAEARKHVIKYLNLWDTPSLDAESRQSLREHAYNSAPSALSVTPRSYRTR